MLQPSAGGGGLGNEPSSNRGYLPLLLSVAPMTARWRTACGYCVTVVNFKGQLIIQ